MVTDMTALERLSRAVADPSRPERLSPCALPVRFAVERARKDNRGAVRVGDSSVGRSDPGLAPGRALGLRGAPAVDLAEVFVLADFSGDGVEASYGGCA